ncbi:TetR/AcrR family transcriptional regulator [candidate division KSB1 bacterium]|nr:TetR/AcrR family transcriptional regulator [candidate division KSB1 bacterium]
MGINERREREKEQRTNDIIDAAERVFAEKGVSAATMDDVATEAELSKGTLYLYFKSKEELYRAINVRGFMKLIELFREAIQSESTGLQQVRAIGRAYLNYSKDYPDYFNAMLHFESSDMVPDFEAGSIEANCVAKGHDALDLVVEALNNGIADGSIRKDVNPQKTAVILWGFCTGFIQLIAKKGEHFEDYHHLNTDDLITESFLLIKRSLET